MTSPDDKLILPIGGPLDVSSPAQGIPDSSLLPNELPYDPDSLMAQIALVMKASHESGTIVFGSTCPPFRMFSEHKCVLYAYIMTNVAMLCHSQTILTTIAKDDQQVAKSRIDCPRADWIRQTEICTIIPGWKGKLDVVSVTVQLQFEPMVAMSDKNLKINLETMWLEIYER